MRNGISMKAKPNPTEFELFVKRYYPEHGKRIFKGRRKAQFARLAYPMLSFFIPGILGAGLGLYVYSSRLTLACWAGDGPLHKFFTPAALESYASWIMIFTFFISVVCLMLGAVYGQCKAHTILFEKEKLTIKLRKLWLAEPKQDQFSSTLEWEDSFPDPEL